MSDSFTHHTDEDGIAWLVFDQAGSNANILGGAVLDELDHTLMTIAQQHPRGLVVRSGKPSGFVAGADVKAFAGISDETAAEQLIRRAHNVLARLENLPFPTVAAIHGYCLGGGLELALACRYRVATDDATTRLAFPETRLGIFPAFGGTVRAVRVIGDLPALDLMLSNRSLSGRAARKVGLVDDVVPRRQLETAARYFVLDNPPRRRPKLLHRISGTGLLRLPAAWMMRKRITEKASPEHYPAPYALVDHWRKYARNPAEMYHSEARQVARLLTGETARNLVRVFLLQERLKIQGDKGTFTPSRIHVVGAGIMGGDIAAWCALQGFRVSLQDQTPQHLSRALGRARRLCEKRLKDSRRVRDTMDRLMPDHRGSAVPQADLVIEAIYEDADAKQELFRRIEPQLKPGSLLATNTSSIPLEVVGEALGDTSRLVGLHFFNPVAKMPLLEIVRGQRTSQESVAKACAAARHINKLPLVVRSNPGFLVNRILVPYLLEAVQLVDEGLPPVAVDHAAEQFGMPMGPVELADTVGLDICLSVAAKLTGTDAIPRRLRELVDSGKLGKKSGEGFYTWRNGRAEKDKIPTWLQDTDDLADRLVLRMVNEAVACLREGVVDDEDLLDAGVVFGTGFAPFRGGPLHYIRSAGIHRLHDRLGRLESSQGKRFAADKGWQELKAP